MIRIDVAFLFSYIKLYWNEARDKFSELLELLNENGKYNFSHDFILFTVDNRMKAVHKYD